MAASRVAVIAAFFGNLVIAILKLVAGLAAQSSAMLAESAHSFSDTGNQVLLFLGLKRAKTPPTPEHPYGGGKAAYFWPFLVAVLLFAVAGAYSAFEGIQKLRDPHPVADIRWSLAVLGGAFVIEAITLGVAVRAAVKEARASDVKGVGQFLKENRDATLLTVIVEDSLALVGLPIAAAALLLTTYTHNPLWDAAGSLVIGLLLMGFALFLGAEARALLIGRGLSPRDLERVHGIIRGDPEVVGIVSLQSMYMGPDTVLLGVEVDVRDEVAAGEVEHVVARVEAALKEALPKLKFIYIEPVHPSVPPAAEGGAGPSRAPGGSP